jgi:hypothetical protein
MDLGAMILENNMADPGRNMVRRFEFDVRGNDSKWRFLSCGSLVATNTNQTDPNQHNHADEAFPFH